MSSFAEPGTIIGGRYRIECLLGRGGMGIVVGAVHVELGHRVALKLLKDEHATDKEVVERLLREARAAATLKSDHIAKVIDVARLPSGTPYIVMEYLEGRDLAGLLEQGPLAIPDAVGLISQACEGLAEAHRAGIVHRDVKPQNLFVIQNESGAHVKVLDFGIARHMKAASKLTQTATVIGSPPYMAPEQMIASDVDTRTDVWSLGATLYELLVGRQPFPGATMPEIYARIVQGPAEPPHRVRPEIPLELSSIVMRCLSRDPNGRPSDAAALAHELAPFVPAHLQVAVARLVPLVAWGATTRVAAIATRPKWIPLTIAGGIGAVVLFVGILALWPKSHDLKPVAASPPAVTTTTTTPPIVLDDPPVVTNTVSVSSLPVASQTTKPAIKPVMTTTRPATSASHKGPQDDPFSSRKW